MSHDSHSPHGTPHTDTWNVQPAAQAVPNTPAAGGDSSASNHAAPASSDTDTAAAAATAAVQALAVDSMQQ